MASPQEDCELCEGEGFIVESINEDEIRRKCPCLVEAEGEELSDANQQDPDYVH